MAELKIGEQSKPRFEFRSFGQNFCEAHKRMARLSVPVPEKVWERESDEIYIISAKNDINNTKIRNGKANPDLAAVRVHKQRFGYMVNDTICEVGNVLINGAKVVTINSESTEIEDIKKTISDCGLEGVENINYLQAIKRVIGMIDKPLANE